MTLGKIGTTLGKEIIAWTRSGKNLLAMIPVKINTAGLKLAPQLERDTIEITKKTIDAVEPYRSLLVRNSDKQVVSKYYKEYLSDKEIKSLNKYIETYGNNSGLREGIISKGDLRRDGAFLKAPALQDNATVYRGLERLRLNSSQKYIDSLKPGMIIKEPAFLSTSTSLSDLKNTIFIDNAFNSHGAIMRIQLPKGTKGILLDYNEYLLPRNSKIKINSMEIVDGTKILNCEYLLS